MDNINNLCMGCMNELNEEDICRICGEKRGEPQETPFLPKKTIIGSRYAIGSGLEINGEGLSYIGYDTIKGMKVYIREFFPSNMCSRDIDFKNVSVSPYKKGLFEKTLKSFLKYFKSVARLRNIPALSAIYDIFNENRTSYVVMEWIDGTKLDKFIGERGGPMPWDEAKPMFMPLISALSKMHESGVLHLGISPNNLLVTEDAHIRLVGFAISDLRKLNSPIDAQIYDGCSALEQYIEIYEMDQSTDVYGMTASLFLALTGDYPQAATKRKKDDRLFMPKDIVRSIPDTVISGIASGLRVYPNNRTLSFERLRAELSNSPIAQISLAKEQKLNNKTKLKQAQNKNFILGMVSCGIALLILVVCFIIYWFVLKRNNSSANQNNISSQIQSSVDELDETENEVKNQIIAPDLTDKKFDELKTQDKNQVGYEVLLLSEEFSDSVEAGRVISQTPSAGEEIYEGSVIAVNISKGRKNRELPVISGKSISEASMTVASAGFKPIESWSYNENIAEGIVIGYADHKEGDSIEYGSEVVIVRSLGAKN